MTDLRTRVRARIRRLGWTQAKTADKANITPAKLCVWLQGGKEFKPETLERLATALGGVYRQTIQWHRTTK